MKLFLAGIFILAGALVGNAQIAAGGTYTLDKSVIASGGGTSRDQSSVRYVVRGTIGQAAAGTISSGGTYSLNSGFHTPASVVATAAEVSIGGRVLTPDGRGLTNAVVYLIEQSGATRTVRTSSFGYYRFDGIAAGETVIVTVAAKRYRFAPQVVTVSGEITDLNFFAPK